MKSTWLIIWMIAIAIPATAQNTATVGDFTKSPTEHIINKIDRPFVVRSLHGVISRSEGHRDPLRNVLLEIEGPGTKRKIRRTTTDEHGRFEIGHVPAGNYAFKATLDGFQSVMGSITISKKAAARSEVRLKMRVGVFHLLPVPSSDRDSVLPAP